MINLRLRLPLAAAGIVLVLSCASVPDNVEPVADAPAASRWEGAPCGGLAGRACGEGLTCFYPAGSCGRGDQGGTCKRRPELCPHIYQPVCGCDGNSYGNGCEAGREGVSLLRRGRCDQPGEPVQ